MLSFAAWPWRPGRRLRCSSSGYSPLDTLYPIGYKMAPRERMAMRVKRLREQRGLTQEQLAEKAGISRPYLARLETARQDPTLSTLEKLAKALRVKVGRLLE